MNDHIIVKSFSDTGRPLPSVALPLGKSETAVRILRKIAKGSDEMDGDTLADLDSGRIKFSTIAKLFQRSELERAVKIRLADVDLAPDEREQLLSLQVKALANQPLQTSLAVMSLPRRGCSCRCR